MEKKIVCAITGNEYPADQTIPLSALDKNMQLFIQGKYGNLDQNSSIGDDQLLHLKKEYLNQILANEFGELDELEHEVIKSISENKILSEKIDFSFKETLTFGDRLADNIAELGEAGDLLLPSFHSL